MTLDKAVKFDRIRYANCWEDPEVLLKGLAPKEGARLLSIASGGDNTFALLLANPAMVVAADLSEVQLYLMALKIAAIQRLNREEVLQFLGFREATNRWELYQIIRPHLEEGAQHYWDGQAAFIATGVIHQGKFEKYFQLFSSRVLPLIHSKKTVRQLFTKKSKEEQSQFYHKKWNTVRWRWLFKLFFSRWLMGKLGRDPAFLKHVETNVGETIFNKAAKHLGSEAAQSNFILHYNLCGHYGVHLPMYLQEAHYQQVKDNLHKVVLFHGYANEAYQNYGSFDGMNLSNIFEYMDDAQFQQTALQLSQALNPDGRMAYWNLMVNRWAFQVPNVHLRHKEVLSSELTKMDRGFFYQQFLIDEKR